MVHLTPSVSESLPSALPLLGGTKQYTAKEEWEPYRAMITRKFSEEGLTLKAIIELLRAEGFQVTERQLKRKTQDWHIEKKVKGTEMGFIVKKQQSRKLQGKDTRFHVRGKAVPQAKIQHYRKQIEKTTGYPMLENICSPQSASTPVDVSYGTPSVISSPRPSPIGNEDNYRLSENPRTGNHHDDGLYSEWDDPTISDILRHQSVFGGQSPAPFTAPPSPALVVNNISRQGTYGSNHTNDLNHDLYHSFIGLSTALRSSGPQVSNEVSGVDWIALLQQFGICGATNTNEGLNKTRYLQKEEFELANRLTSLQLTFGSTHSATLDTACKLATILLQQSRLRSAEAIIKQSAILWEHTVGWNDPRLLAALNMLTRVYLLQGKYSVAHSLASEIHTRACQTMSRSDTILLEIKISLGRSLILLDRLSDGELQYRDVIRAGRHPHDQILITAMQYLAFSLYERGEYTESIGILGAVIDARLLCETPLSASYYCALSFLGHVSSLMGDNKKGCELLQDGHLNLKKILGPDHPQTLFAQCSLASSICALGPHQDCERIFRDVHLKQIRVRGKTCLDTIQTEHGLALCLMRQGQHPESQKWGEEAVGASVQVLGRKSSITHKCKRLLGESYYQQSRLSEALSMYKEALEGCPGGVCYAEHMNRVRDIESRLVEGWQDLEQA